MLLKEYDKIELLVTVSIKSIPILIGTAQLFVILKSNDPAAKVALEKEPKEPLYVPKFVSFTVGKLVTMLETSKLEVDRFKSISSDRTIFTEPVDPGLCTEATLSAVVLGIVLPTKDAVDVEEPPLAGTLEKLNDAMVALVMVSTKSIFILNGTGQLFTSSKSIEPAENVALVNDPNEPPLYVPRFVSFMDGKGAL
jgi:hypothetical protein